MQKLSRINYCYIAAAILAVLVSITTIHRIFQQNTVLAVSEVTLTQDESPTPPPPSDNVSSPTGIQVVSIEKDPLPSSVGSEQSPASSPIASPTNSSFDPAAPPTVDERYSDRTPYEAGTVMIHLLHRFVPAYEGGDKSVTMTLDYFRSFLQKLYDDGYRPISMEDFLSNNVSLPAGCRPTLLTFDDGWASQFQFIEENGQLVADSNTAVGVWEAFTKEHPDFETRGVFYLNLGRETTFGEKGTLKERLEYLINLGFELGNHTYTHLNLRELSESEVIFQVGKNQAALKEVLPEYRFRTLALPFGNYRPDILSILASGEYEGVSYQNEAVFLAGAEPTLTPTNVNFNIAQPLPRILAPGIEEIFMDSSWWLANQSPEKQYTSDGNPATVTIPAAKLEQLDPNARSKWEVIISGESTSTSEATATN